MAWPRHQSWGAWWRGRGRRRRMARQRVEEIAIPAEDATGDPQGTDRTWHTPAPSGSGLVVNRNSLVKLAITAAVVICALLRWDAGASFFLGLLAASVSGLLDGRVSVAAGLACLACCPLLLLAEQYAWLQQS